MKTRTVQIWRCKDCGNEQFNSFLCQVCDGKHFTYIGVRKVMK